MKEKKGHEIKISRQKKKYLKYKLRKNRDKNII